MAVNLRSVTRAAPHTQQGATLIDVTDVTYSKVRNGFGECTFSIPQGSAQLATLRPWVDEVRVEYKKDSPTAGAADTKFWGPVVDRQTTPDGKVLVRCYDFRVYLDSRFVGDAERTNLIANGDFNQGTLGQSPPPGWTESGGTGGFNAQNSNTVLPMADSPFYAELTFQAGSRIIDKRNDGKDVKDPKDPDDYHAPDESLQQGFLATPTGGVFIVRGWSFTRSDAIFGFGGKAYDDRGLFVEVRDGAGGLVDTLNSPLPNNSENFEQWIRHELRVIASPGGSLQFRLHCHAAEPAKAAGVAWSAVGCYREESLSFPDSTDTRAVIEGLVTHAQDNTFGKTPAGGAIDIGNDPASVNSGQVWPLFAYQHSDHRNIWEAMLEYAAPRNPVPVELVATWNATATARYLRVKPSDTIITASLVLGSNCLVANHYERGNNVVTRGLAVGPGDGPDREEASYTDTTALSGLVLEGIFPVPDTELLRNYGRIAQAAVQAGSKTERTMRITLTDRDVSGAASWMDREPGDAVAFTGTWGAFSYTAKAMRLLALTHDVGTGVITYDLAEH